MNNICIILTGPTAVGKTAVSLNLAEKINGEIINGDMGQCYTPLTIGTAKPDWRHEKIPHHLFDIIDQPQSWSVVEYRKKVTELIQKIWQRGKIPIIVGGSGFYIRSLFFPIEDSPEVIIPQEWNMLTTRQLWDRLIAVDPMRAGAIHHNDRYRILRALTLWESGRVPSENKPHCNFVATHIKLIVLTRNRDDLYARIDERCSRMLQQGWIDEVKNLSVEWKEFLLEKKIIGYPEIISYLEGNMSYEKMETLIAQKTRNYAKRQLTFMRMLCRQLKECASLSVCLECNLTISDVNLYIEQLAYQIACGHEIF